jgi:hypothetical protein
MIIAALALLFVFLLAGIPLAAIFATGAYLARRAHRNGYGNWRFRQ